MTMEVRGPNDIVVRFPDGTDPATIDKAMREAAGQAPQVSTMEDVAKGAGSGLTRGASYVAGMWGDVQGLGDKASQAALNLVSGRSPDEQAKFDQFKARTLGALPPPPTSSQVSGAAE